MPILSSSPARRAAVRYDRVYVPLGTLITAWEFLRANGARGEEQLCFLAGRVVIGAAGSAAQVTSCVLPLTVATEAYVTLTSHAQTALILDALEARDEVALVSLHTHGDGGVDGCGPRHSEIDDHGVALAPEDGIFSAVIPYFALGSPLAFPGHAGVYERWGGAWRRLDEEERGRRIVVHGDALRFVRKPGGAA